MKKVTALLTAILFWISIFVGSASADQYSDGRTDAMSFWFDPDMSPGETFASYFGKKQYRYIYKEAVVSQTTNSTYFMINGSAGDSRYPDFYGGLQQLGDGRRVALFSAWDLGTSNCEYFSCKPNDADEKNRIALWAKGDRVVSQRGGGEGTFYQSFIYDFNWKIGEKISWLVSLEPAGNETLLSAAIKQESTPWEFFASYLIPTRFTHGLPGGYGFIEDFGSPNTPFTPRSMSIGPTIAETSKGERDVFTNVYVGSSKDKSRHKVTVVGASVLGQVGTEVQADAKPDYRVRLGTLTAIPDYNQGKEILENAVKGKTTRYQEELKRLEEEAATKAAAEANARAEAEAKAKIEAALKAEAEAKAKEAAELQARKDAEAAAKKAATEFKKRTITCIKGKLTKKISGNNPKCPKGYLKK